MMNEQIVEKMRSGEETQSGAVDLSHVR